MFNWTVTNKIALCNSVNFEATLEDGTVVSKGDGVEFTVEEGMFG